jgi:hypothetical protein
MVGGIAYPGYSIAKLAALQAAIFLSSINRKYDILISPLRTIL